MSRRHPAEDDPDASVAGFELTDGALDDYGLDETEPDEVAYLLRLRPAIMRTLRSRIAEIEADLEDWRTFREWVKEDPLRLAGDGYAEQLFWEERAQLRGKPAESEQPDPRLERL